MVLWRGVACSRLRDSRGLEPAELRKREHKNKTGGNWGEKGWLFPFSHPANLSRAFYFRVFPAI